MFPYFYIQLSDHRQWGQHNHTTIQLVHKSTRIVLKLHRTAEKIDANQNQQGRQTGRPTRSIIRGTSLPSFYFSTHSVRKKKHESNLDPINPPHLSCTKVYSQPLLQKLKEKRRPSFYSSLQLTPFSPATSDHWLPGYTHVA